MITLNDLNLNQRKAFCWNGGPLLVLAGPGSGKTEVLTLRVVRLLEADENNSVLALTFTNKAAAEMRNRVTDHLVGRTERVRLCTLHAFALDLLGQHGSHVGIRPNFSLAQSADRATILEGAICRLRDAGADVPSDRVNLLRLIDRLFSESYKGTGTSSSLAKTPRWLPRLFRRYCNELVSANRLDFGSLLYFANQLLREKDAIRRSVRLGWTHVCVDEFQDMNVAQYDLLRFLAPDPESNLFVVADDDQIVYQWNGASPKRLRDLRHDYQPHTICLPESYRCLSEIVDCANLLVEHNQGRFDPSRKLVSARPPQELGGVVRCEAFDRISEEARFVGRDIIERKLSVSKCAVIGRTNWLVRRAAEELRRGGHEVFVPRRKTDFDSPVLGVLVEALRLANARHDRVVLHRLCRQWGRMTGAMIEPQAVEGAAALFGGDFLRAWTEFATKDGRGRRAVRRIQTTLLDGLDFPEVVDSFLDGEWRFWGNSDADGSAEEEIATWKMLHQEIVGRGNGTTVNAYLQRLDLESKSPQRTPRSIQCITIHGSKGIQFEHVYLVGMAQGIFPSYRALQEGKGSQQLEEERRSCFVAITRARETLTLTRAREYHGYAKPASQFLREMGLVGPARSQLTASLSLRQTTPGADPMGRAGRRQAAVRERGSRVE